MFDTSELYEKEFQKEAATILLLAISVNAVYYGGVWLLSEGYITATEHLALFALTFLLGGITAGMAIKMIWKGWAGR